MKQLLLLAGLLLPPGVVLAAPPMPSTCYGTPANGRLVGGVRLPGNGPNFESYGNLPELLGRTYVHSRVRDAVIGAYHQLEATQPGKVFKYAETGYREGGRFKPHKTHRNGQSVDFIVPVVDARGKSVYLPTHALNKYGYAIDFDRAGRYQDYWIDFEAMAAHLVALRETARRQGISIRRVLFDPRLQPKLYRTRRGSYIRRYIRIPNKRSWVIHDDHYHVDFAVRCRPMASGEKETPVR